MKRCCSNCDSCSYDAERGHLKCKETGKVIYVETDETCDEWKKRIPIKLKQSEMQFGISQTQNLE